MNKILSRLSLLCLSVFSLLSCEVDTDYEIIKKNADYSDSYTNKDAYSIFYYKQPVTGESDYSAWERDTESDVTNTYVSAGSSVSSLNNKAYEGFVFAGIVQNDTTINVFYKRCTICYEFYSLIGDTKPLFKIKGLYGMHSLKPILNDTEDSYFDSWYTQNQVAYTRTFCINSDSNTVNDVSTTKWYASWRGKLFVMGLSMNLVDAGDILLKDGSVIPFAKRNAMTDEQLKSVVAVLVSNSYNPQTGSVTDGTVRLIASLQTYKAPWLADGESSILQKQNFKTTDSNGKTNMEMLLTLDTNLRKSTKRTSAILYSYDFDINAILPVQYKNDWYLPSTKELKILHDDESVFEIYKKIIAFDVDGQCWTSTSSEDDAAKIQAFTINSAETEDLEKNTECYVIPFRQID